MSPSALHVNDAAFTAQRLIVEASRRGLKWRLLQKAAPDQVWPGVTGHVRRAAIGGRWVGRLALLARRHDIVHVHSASTVAHSRWGARRYLLHCHGTDVRTAQYDTTRRRSIVNGLRRAEAVFYSTPDLAEHVLGHRPDAVHLPVPIDVDAVPRWTPGRGLPKVVFASRWSPDKGVDIQLALARMLTPMMRGRAELIGLDWGSNAGEAAKAGVRLVPRVGHDAYLRLLSGAHVVIGQAAGILAASELEATAAGAPVVVPVALPLYGTDLPVHAGGIDQAAEATVSLLDGGIVHDPVPVRAWTRARHGVVRAVDTVDAVYADVLAARR